MGILIAAVRFFAFCGAIFLILWAMGAYQRHKGELLTPTSKHSKSTRGC